MAQNGEQKGMDEGTIFLTLILVIAAAWLIWHFQKELLIYPCFAMDWLQYFILYKINFLDKTGMQSYQFVYNILHYKSFQEPYKSNYDIMKVTWEQFKYVQNDIGSRTFILWCLIIGIIGGVTIFKMKGDGFRRVFTLTGVGMGTVIRFGGITIENKFIKNFITADYKNKILRWLVSKILFLTGIKMFVKKTKEWKRNGVSFAHYQAEEWKVILCGANFDPDKENPNEAPQKKPIDWLRDHKISLTEQNGLDTDAVEAQLAIQLGASWSGLENAPVHIQAICVLAALNLLHGDPDRPKYRDKVEKLRNELNIAFQKDEVQSKKEASLLLSPFLSDKIIVNAINRIGSKYAYINTACLAVYAWGGPMQEWGGGKAGILSSSMFRWLKKIDRTLWYALNNVGRRKFHVEASGVVNHFFAERIWGSAIDEPHIDQAVEGVIKYLEFRNITDMDKFYKKRKDFD